jgi:hypothetical protein
MRVALPVERQLLGAIVVRCIRRAVGLLTVSLPLVALAAGCSSTHLASSRVNPDFKGRGYSKVMVVGVSSRPEVRQVFEDEFAAALRQRGIEAVSSHTLIPGVGRADARALAAAVDAAGADSLLVARLVGREQRTEMQSMPPPSSISGGGRYPGYYGQYSGAWVNYYDPVDLHQYDVVTLDIRLLDAKGSDTAWAGSTETVEPGNLKKGVAGLATVVIKELESKKLLAPNATATKSQKETL